MSDVEVRTTSYVVTGGAQTIAQRDRFEFDTGGFLRRSYGNDGQQLIYTYDPNGQVVQTVDALARTTAYEYDTHGRLKKITDPADGRTSEVTFDLLDRPTQVRAWYPAQGAWQ